MYICKVFQGHSVAEVFEAGLECLILLSAVVGPALNPHLKMLLIPVGLRHSLHHCLVLHT